MIEYVHDVRLLPLLHHTPLSVLRCQPCFPLQEHTKNHKWSMCLLAFSATLREGIESVLFLTGVGAGSSVKAVIIPGIVGLIVGILTGVAIFYL
jgi:FTR1 family protein